MQLPSPLHARRCLQPGKLHSASQAQAIGHGRHDELALKRGDRKRQALVLTWQHQMVAALCIQRHPRACQRGGQFRRMGATADKHLAGFERAPVAGKAHAGTVQLPAIDLRLDKAHPTGLGRFEQFAHHPIRVDEVPGARKEQSAQQ